jgi:hypothetical protein
MKRFLRISAAAVLVMAALMAALAALTWLRSWNDGPHPDKKSIELKDAKAIAAALARYADAHAHVWPPSLESLKPEYLEPRIDVTRCRFFHPGHRKEGGRDGRVIAVTEAVGFTNYSICIYGFGAAGYLRKGE